jgi:hypothetical protein
MLHSAEIFGKAWGKITNVSAVEKVVFKQP